ncbi:MAG: relaxase/mobilization nuclease domain-containing protein [Desulfamplus sp.]|nr:relaxase/mobilization nuclease domain-containing protein [Desulfamplus sp.]
MLIKSLSKTTASAIRGKTFAPMVRYVMNYVNNEEKSWFEPIAHNLRSDPKDLIGIILEFEENHTFAQPRKNGGVVVYHEIISFHPDDTAVITPELLRVICRKYLSHRAKDALAFCNVHRDQDHIHVHILISGNKIRSSKQHWLTRQEFQNIQIEMESFQKQQFPELQHSFCFQAEQAHKRKLNKQQLEQELGIRLSKAVEQERNYRLSRKLQREKSVAESRNRKASVKDQLREQVLETLQSASSKLEFQIVLQQKGIGELYERGHDSDGIISASGKKYRFKTLGVLEEWKQRKIVWEHQEHKAEQTSEHSLEI